VKRVSLELGGKSPLIIFPDADLESASATAMAGVWGASGQVCTCSTRVLVHESAYDEVVERIVEQSRGIRIGGGFEPDVDMGPVVSAAQLERIQRYVRIGRDEGAELALGGSRHGDRGYFHEPTVFTGVRNEMTIAQEEIFGPVMSVLKFSSEEEAYRIANDVEYGLAAGVWTNDIARAHRATRALRVGTVWVNTYQMVYPSVPYGGVKQSGHGRNLGEASLDEFTQTKSVWMKVG
jgi:acyl-CoA reductase-like NAD-dependent aldehyde dehydrogenase